MTLHEIAAASSTLPRRTGIRIASMRKRPSLSTRSGGWPATTIGLVTEDQWRVAVYAEAGEEASDTAKRQRFFRNKRILTEALATETAGALEP